MLAYGATQVSPTFATAGSVAPPNAHLYLDLYLYLSQSIKPNARRPPHPTRFILPPLARPSHRPRLQRLYLYSGQSRNLHEDDFDDYIFKSDHLIVLVEFSSPWCIWAHPNSGVLHAAARTLH